jgi:hypothetical protein
MKLYRDSAPKLRIILAFPVILMAETPGGLAVSPPKLAGAFFSA